jgi:formate hydrogenlyase subunit 3/multisubunit Na+/H+ antiporter MnhD subunit
MEKKYVLTALVYALVGLVLGIYMAATRNHSQLVTHAHVMMLGFVVSFIYAVCLKLWIKNTSSKMVISQFILHQVGTLFLLVGLFLMYGQHASIDDLELVLSLSSVAVLLAALLMLIQFVADNGLGSYKA